MAKWDQDWAISEGDFLSSSVLKLSYSKGNVQLFIIVQEPEFPETIKICNNLQGSETVIDRDTFNSTVFWQTAGLATETCSRILTIGPFIYEAFSDYEAVLLAYGLPIWYEAPVVYYVPIFVEAALVVHGCLIGNSNPDF